MFVRTTTSRRGSKTYRYAQLVESYRKPDGTPTHRILCSLKGLSDVAVGNLRAALEAGRKGQAIVVEPEAADALRSIVAEANLRYLDVAIAYEIWRQLGLDTLLAEVLPHSEAKVRAEEVVTALVIHRCTSPGSKLAAARWYPRTALPELQGIAPGRFHNTRVHRTLDALDQVEAQLQTRLPEHLRAEQGSFVSLFLDITDTWFEGRGPAMAYNAQTKEGLLRRKIGLALLCDRRGFPLRWQTLPGNYYEAREMGALVEQIAALDWAHEVPIVLDRMMGRGEALAQLADTGVRFVTALPVSEFDSWTSKVPWQPLAEVVLSGTEAGGKEDLARLKAAAKRAKLQEVRSDRWVLDLGVETRTDLGADTQEDRSAGPIAQAVRRAIAMKADLDAGVVRSTAKLAEHEGVSQRTVRDYLQLARLAPAVQRRVLAGEAGLTLARLRSIARRPADQQEAALEAAIDKHGGRARQGRRPKLSAGPSGPGVSVRLVVGFSPKRFIKQRTRALERLREIEAFVADLNRRLRTPQSRRGEASVRAEVDRLLRSKNWLKLFEVQVDGETAGDWQVRLLLDEQEWAKRRRYDGFNLLVAHPDIPSSAPDLVDLYFAKDAVEKDFETIKSELEMRPIRHKTDLKVRAHVTLCVLALLVNRMIEQRLRAGGLPMTAPAAFEHLEPRRLNLLKLGSRTTYTVTQLDADSRAILTTLGMGHLADDEHVRARIRPRRGYEK